MAKATKAILTANVLLLVLILRSLTTAHAQQPPETDSAGTAYLRVNINPTNVPPMVNINPNQSVPRVQVMDMPELKVAPAGCSNRKNFLTGVGRSITGPLMVTYLRVPPQTTVTLGDAAGGHSMNFAAAAQITTAIFLQPTQQLEFNAEVMYSGCRPD